MDIFAKDEWEYRTDPKHESRPKGVGWVTTEKGWKRKTRSVAKPSFPTPERRSKKGSMPDVDKIADRIARTYPPHYFTHTVHVGPGQYGLIAVDNKDLTGEGLIAKMREWQMVEGGVPEGEWDDIVDEMKKKGVKPPTGIRKVASNRVSMKVLSQTIDSNGNTIKKGTKVFFNDPSHPITFFVENIFQYPEHNNEIVLNGWDISYSGYHSIKLGKNVKKIASRSSMNITKELQKIASMITADYDYQYDPDHKNRPQGSEWKQTPSGWSKTDKTVNVTDIPVKEPKRSLPSLKDISFEDEDRVKKLDEIADRIFEEKMQSEMAPLNLPDSLVKRDLISPEVWESIKEKGADFSSFFSDEEIDQLKSNLKAKLSEEAQDEANSEFSKQNTPKNIPVDKEWDTENFLSPEYAKAVGSQYKDISYTPFKKLSESDKKKAIARYPHKSVGAKYNFKDNHFFYPTDKYGNLDSTGRRIRRVLAIPFDKIKDNEYMKNLGYQVNPDWKGA